MEQIFTNIKNIVPIQAVYAISALIVVLLFILLILRNMRLRFAKKELERLESKFDAIKGIPLSFKINKAVALGRVNKSLNDRVFEAQQIYDKVNEEMRKSTTLLAEMDDLLYSKKHRQVVDKAVDLEKQLDKLKVDVENVDVVLDDILSQESEKRDQINRLKEQFRLLKQKIGIDKTKFYQGKEYIDFEISAIEKMFSLFEEWMFASEFEKANEQYNEINTHLTHLEAYVNATPTIFDIIHNKLQKQIDSISYAYQSYRNEHIYIEHLGVKNNLELVSNVIKESIAKLFKGKFENTKEELEQCDLRLIQLSDQLVKEFEAFNEVPILYPAIANHVEQLNKNTNNIQALYEKYYVRFSLEDFSTQIDEFKVKMTSINETLEKLSVDENANVPATTYIVELKKLQEDCNKYEASIAKLKTLLHNVVSDEKRARQQLLKLSLIVHEIGIKMSKSKVSYIEKEYEDDLSKARSMVFEIQNLIDASVVNVEYLNTKIKEGIDFIYTLYHNVNNFVGKAVMVENLIVFGNRYRSTYPELNSQLIRSELYYRNGEYSKSLQIAVSAIEKIVPGIYEKLISGVKKEEVADIQ